MAPSIPRNTALVRSQSFRQDRPNSQTEAAASNASNRNIGLAARLSGSAVRAVSSAPQRHGQPLSDYLDRLLESPNWVSVYGQLVLEQPRLAELLAAIDDRLPHRLGESAVIAGHAFRLAFPARSYLRDAFTMHDNSRAEGTECEIRPGTGPQLRRNSTSQIQTATPRTQGVTTAHNEVLRRLLCQLLTADDFIEAIPDGDAALHRIDITEAALSRALSTLRPATLPRLPRQPAEPALWSSSTRQTSSQRTLRIPASRPAGGFRATLSSHPLRDLDRSNNTGSVTHRHTARTESVSNQPGQQISNQATTQGNNRVSHPLERTALMAALMIRQADGKQSSEFPLASENWIQEQHRATL